jgi:hypothetical protein
MEYSTEEVERLSAHYAALKDKVSYDAFVRSAHELLKRIGADPYHVRMALTRRVVGAAGDDQEGVILLGVNKGRV